MSVAPTITQPPSPPHAAPTAATPSVSDLLLRAGEGDATAWEEIVRRYGRLVLAKVRSFRLQEADALDAVQMTWLRLAENYHRVQSPEHLGGWLATTASRECLRILRHQAKQTPTCAEAVAYDVADPALGPEQHVINADTARLLRNLVTELPPRGRSLLRALFADNPRPYAEIAHTTGIPIGSIGPIRARALERLRWMLDERGLERGA
ncbi:MAG: RNA polymerase sigma factor [Pseudonocardiaceae bacterium]